MKIKHIVGLLLIISLVAFKAIEEKKYSVNYTEQEWNSRYSWIVYAKGQLLKSNLPINEIKPLTDSLDKFLGELSSQLIPQIKPPVADSTKKKK